MPDATRDKGLDRSLKIELERAKIDADKRTIEVAFSSETPVERWGENEVLSHDARDYDFTRLNDSHPLLLGHNQYDPDSQIGVIESARVDGDKVGRAIVRFSRSAKGEEIFRDVQDGIRKLVSVGYDRTSIVSSEKAADGMVTTRYRWMPTHIAIVPVPADTKAGVGRNKPTVDSIKELSAEELAQGLTPEQKQRMKLLLDPAPVDGGGGTKAPVLDFKAERVRCSEIRKIADKLSTDRPDCREKIAKIAGEALESDATVNDFQLRALQEVFNAKPATPLAIEQVADDKMIRDYSFIRGIASCIRGAESGRGPVPDGVEGEVHQEIINKGKRDGGLGYSPKGFQVPYNAPVRAHGAKLRRGYGRDMQATIFPSGGAFVPTELRLPFIELLRNEIVLTKSGMRVMGGLHGNIVIPRQTAPATAYSVAEVAALTASQQVLDQIQLQPRRVGATEVYSKQLLLQSSPDVEAFIRDDLFQVLALRWDYLGLNGQGAASEPLGLMNTPGIGSITFGATPTYIKIVAMETALRVANVRGPLVYMSTPSTKGSLKTVAEALTGATTIGGSQNAIWKGMAEGEGEVNGYPAYDSNQIPHDQVILGDFSQLIMGLWGGLDVVVDPYTKAANAEIVLTLNTWGDYALRHPQAFIVSADAGNQ